MIWPIIYLAGSEPQQNRCTYWYFTRTESSFMQLECTVALESVKRRFFMLTSWNDLSSTCAKKRSTTSLCPTASSLIAPSPGIFFCSRHYARNPTLHIGENAFRPKLNGLSRKDADSVPKAGYDPNLCSCFLDRLHLQHDALVSKPCFGSAICPGHAIEVFNLWMLFVVLHQDRDLS